MMISILTVVVLIMALALGYLIDENIDLKEDILSLSYNNSYTQEKLEEFEERLDEIGDILFPEIDTAEFDGVIEAKETESNCVDGVCYIDLSQHKL